VDISLPGRFNPGERVPGTHWIGGWVGSRTGLDEVAKKKRQKSNPGRPTCSLVTTLAATSYIIRS